MFQEIAPNEEEIIKSALKSGGVRFHSIDIVEAKDISSLSIPDRDEVVATLDESNKDLIPMIDMVYRFLETPVIEDHFDADDRARDKWEAAVYKQFGERGSNIILRNRLRVNVIGEVLSVIDIFPDFLEDDDLREILNSMDKRAYDTEVYKSLPLEEKLKVVASVTQTGIKMLKHLAKK